MNDKDQNKQDLKRLVIESTLSLAVSKGWEYTTMRDIARESKLTMVDLYDLFEDKTEILSGLGRLIDRKILENAPAPSAESETSPRDLLFDLFMERYDALNRYREGICAILDSLKFDPKQLLLTFPYLCRSMSVMLESSGIETAGLKGALKIAGATGIYLKVLYTWRQDESADLSKTMAALDKALGRAEKIAETLGF